MNAPRQGLFATFLLLGFILNTAIILFSAYHEQTVVREDQGNLLVNQLVLDALPGVLGRDSVALALIADRYTNRPDIAELKIYDLQKNILATNGQAPSRAGQSFERDVLVDQKPIGRVQLRMIVPNMGEIVQQKAPAISLSSLIFIALWFLYRGCARPVQTATPLPLPAAVPPPNPIPLKTTPTVNATPVQTQPTPAPENFQALIRVDLLDPKKYSDLLGNNLAQPLMDMGQTLLERSIQAVQQVDPEFKVNWLQNFSSDGAILTAYGISPEKTIENTTLMAAIFQDAMDTFYQIQRQQQQFAFKTKMVITDLAQFDKAGPLAQQLAQHEQNAKIQLAIGDNNVRSLMTHFSLSPLHTSQNALTRPLGIERFHLLGFHAKTAEQVVRLRNQVLSV